MSMNIRIWSTVLLIAIGLGGFFAADASAENLPVQVNPNSSSYCSQIVKASSARVAQEPVPPKPNLCMATMKNRTRWRMWQWCDRWENQSVIEFGIAMMDCDAWGVESDAEGPLCYYYSLQNPRRGYCKGWMRMYDRHVNNDVHCSGRVTSWIHRDDESPTGWFLSSRLHNRACYYDVS